MFILWNDFQPSRFRFFLFFFSFFIFINYNIDVIEQETPNNMSNNYTEQEW